MVVLGEGVDELFERGHGRRRDPGPAAELEPLRRGARRHDQGHVAVEAVGMGDPRSGGVDALVVGEVRTPGFGEQVHVVLPRVGEHVDPAVAGALRLALGIEDPAVTRRAEGRHRGGGPRVLDEGEGRHDVDHGDLDPLAPAGPLPFEEGGHDGVGDGQPADLVRHQGGDEDGLTVHAPEGVGYARAGLDHVVVGRGVGGG
jgi:hypothetical protein